MTDELLRPMVFSHDTLLALLRERLNDQARSIDALSERLDLVQEHRPCSLCREHCQYRCESAVPAAAATASPVLPAAATR